MEFGEGGQFVGCALQAAEAEHGVAGGGALAHGDVGFEGGGGSGGGDFGGDDKAHFGLALGFVHEDGGGHFDFFLGLIFAGDVAEELHEAAVAVGVGGGAAGDDGEGGVVADFDGAFFLDHGVGGGFVGGAAGGGEAAEEGDGGEEAGEEEGFFHEGGVGGVGGGA